jgi:hypothetical protein
MLPYLGKLLWDAAVIWTITKSVEGYYHQYKAHAAHKAGNEALKNNRSDIDTMTELREANRGLEADKGRVYDAMWETAITNHDDAIAGRISFEESASRNDAEQRKVDEAIGEIDRKIDENESKMKDIAAGVATRSETAIKGLKDLKEQECQTGDCEEQKIRVAGERYERELQSCRKRYGLDEEKTAFALDGSWQRSSAAHRPKCSIETFERIARGFSDRVKAIEDLAGPGAEDLPEETFFDEEARRAMENEYKVKCGASDNSCECRKLDAKIKANALREFEAGRDPAMLAKEMFAQMRRLENSAIGAAKAEPKRPAPLIDYDECSPKEEYRFFSDGKGGRTFKVMPLEAWTPSGYCSLINIPGGRELLQRLAEERRASAEATVMGGTADVADLINRQRDLSTETMIAAEECERVRPLSGETPGLLPPGRSSD